MSLRETLHSWLIEQPLWQQDLARRLVAQRALTDDELGQAILRVKTELGVLAPGEDAHPSQGIALDDLPLRGAVGSPKLVALGRMTGVAAVSPHARLEFAHDGLTIIYGPNGSGKSSYVRALKQVCRTVPHDKTLHGNAFTDIDEPQRAVVEVFAGELKAETIDLQEPKSMGLEALSVFDSHCAQTYIDNQNQVGFLPEELAVLQHLGETQERMKASLKSQEAGIVGRGLKFPEFAAGTKVHALLGQLAATLPEHDLTKLQFNTRVYGSISDEEKARLVELRAVVSAANSTVAEANARAAQAQASQGFDLATRLDDLRARMAPDAQANLRRTCGASWEANQAVEAASRAFSSAPVPGVGGGPWKVLWDAAREFSRQQQQAFPPVTGQACPLCLQTVGDEAAGHLSHFETHVRSSVQQTAENARQEYQQAWDVVNPEHVVRCRGPFLDGLKVAAPQLHAALEGFLADIAARFDALRKQPGQANQAEVSSAAIESLRAWAKAQSDHAQQLLATRNQQGAAAARGELAELNAREQLATRLGEIEDWLTQLARLAGLRTTREALSTRAISFKQSALSDQVVSSVLRDRLAEELAAFACGDIPVTLQSSASYGAPNVTMGLDGMKAGPNVAAVASEGEHRALALGFFLAEVAVGNGDGGLIIDDPVSSFDHDRKLKVAERLVQEAADRQVIVFTHDLPFLLDLMNCAEEAGQQPKVQSVTRYGDTTGHVDGQPPFDAMRLKERLAGLKSDYDRWEKQGPPANLREERDRVTLFYDGMRKAWERAVEEVLFNSVVTRLDRAVNTKSLKDVAIKPEYLAAIEAGMTRCSDFVHDAPSAAPMKLPTRPEMAADLGKIYAFKNLVADDRKAAKKAAKAVPVQA